MPAIVETAATLAIVTAVIGALVASGTFALATPIIFTAVMAGKTLFQAGSAIYYAVKAARTTDAEEKLGYKTLAKNNALGAAAGVLATAAVACVFLFGKFAVAALGIVAAVAGGALAVMKGYKAYKETIAEDEVGATDEETAEERPDSALLIAKGLGLSKKDLQMGFGTEKVVEGSVADVDEGNFENDVEAVFTDEPVVNFKL